MKFGMRKKYIRGKPMTTNYEKIKNMTLEEMAEFFDSHIMCELCPTYDFCVEEGEECRKIFKHWLQSESLQ